MRKTGFTPHLLIALCVMTLVVLQGAIAAIAADAPPTPKWSALIDPSNSYSFHILKDGAEICSTGMIGWGAGWDWFGIDDSHKAIGEDLAIDKPFAVKQGQNIDCKYHAWQTGPKTISFQYNMNAATPVPLTQIVLTLNMAGAYQAGNAVLTDAAGAETKAGLNFGRQAGAAKVATITLKSTAGDIVIALDPPTSVSFDGGMRITLADGNFTGQKTQTIAVTTPDALTMLASQADLDALIKKLPDATWFPFTPSGKVEASVIDMRDWLDTPAGKHGGVRMVDDHFAFTDGTPVKFWGTNLAYGSSAPEKAAADFTAARFAKYGINCVRMHKFTGSNGWDGIGDPNDATKMTDNGLDRLDYFSNQLKQNGVYFGWSHTYHFQVGPGNKDQLIAGGYDEIKAKSNGDTYGLINYAPDIQNLLIQRVVNLLKHKNKYTDLTYAEEPALAYIELQNEDDIFFYTTIGVYNQFPTYKKDLLARYAAWLTKKYATQDGLKAAWGGALKADETLDAKNIEIQANPWFLGQDFLPNQKDGDLTRLLDGAMFFHEQQNDFYSRFVKAIRDAGYQGPICGSPWQAPTMLPHYLNLKSDYLAGFIDRHNYFGGGLFDTMLATPGSGYLSSGLQQVVDRPFGISEWIHVYPSLYSAEGPAIFAAYGMGLQGWSESYEFQSGIIDHTMNPIVGSPPWGVWTVDVPTQIGQFPALARMIYRGDVKEGPIISTRKVSDRNLQTGTFDFKENLNQQGDIKDINGTVPQQALAAGRVVVQFTGKDDAPSTFPDMTKYLKDKVITSNTNQLVWDYTGKGFFTINTDGTKALVGFAGGKSVTLGETKIALDSPYASIFLTSLQKNAPLQTATSALLTVIARNCNTDLTYFVLDKRVMDNGKAPILLEPVKATITISDHKIAAVNILDADGKPTGNTLPVTNGTFTVDGTKDKTMYYQVVFQ